MQLVLTQNWVTDYKNLLTECRQEILLDIVMARKALKQLKKKFFRSECTVLEMTFSIFFSTNLNENKTHQSAPRYLLSENY